MTEVLSGRTNGLYFIDLDEHGEYTFHFRRRDSAATETLLQLDQDRLADYLTRSRWILFSGITLAVMKEPERLAPVLERVRHANYRPALWMTVADYRDRVDAVLPFVDLLLPSEVDMRRVWPDVSMDEFMTLHGQGHVVMKRGAKGCLIRWDDRQFEVPAVNVVPVDTTGAGDAFNGAFITGLVQGRSPQQAARLGNCVAGHVVEVRGAIDPAFSASAVQE